MQTGWIENKPIASSLSRFDGREARPARAGAPGGHHAHARLSFPRTLPDLGSVLDMDVIRGGKVRMGVDPLGGAGVALPGAALPKPTSSISRS